MVVIVYCVIGGSDLEVLFLNKLAHTCFCFKVEQAVAYSWPFDDGGLLETGSCWGATATYWLLHRFRVVGVLLYGSHETASFCFKLPPLP